MEMRVRRALGSLASGATPVVKASPSKRSVRWGAPHAGRSTAPHPWQVCFLSQPRLSGQAHIPSSGWLQIRALVVANLSHVRCLDRSAAQYGVDMRALLPSAHCGEGEGESVHVREIFLPLGSAQCVDRFGESSCLTHGHGSVQEYARGWSKSTHGDADTDGGAGFRHGSWRGQRVALSRQEGGGGMSTVTMLQGGGQGTGRGGRGWNSCGVKCSTSTKDRDSRVVWSARRTGIMLVKGECIPASAPLALLDPLDFSCIFSRPRRLDVIIMSNRMSRSRS